MVVRNELGDGLSKVALPERHDAIQTFLFDGAYEALGVRIGIRGAIRRLDNPQPCFRELVPDSATPLGIPIADEHPVVGERPVVGEDQSGVRRGNGPLVSVKPPGSVVALRVVRPPETSEASLPLTGPAGAAIGGPLFASNPGSILASAEGAATLRRAMNNFNGSPSGASLRILLP